MALISPSKTTDNEPVQMGDMGQSKTFFANKEKNEPIMTNNSDRHIMGEGEAINKAVFPNYPTHGIIGASNPPWLDAFSSSIKSDEEKRHDFRKQKFDFHEMYEKKLLTEGRHGHPIEPSPLPGLYNLWQKFNNGQRTSDVYQTDPSLPKRFQQPELLQGYGCERDENPLFTTVSSAYGKFPPTIHDVPKEYRALKNSFTSHLAKTGMPKNRSLNIK